MPEIKQIELPTGIKYIRAISILAFIVTLIVIIGLVFVLISNPSGIQELGIWRILTTVSIAIVAYLIYKGLGGRKYWGWLIAVIFFSIMVLYNIILFNLIFIPLGLLYIWYLSQRRDFYKTGKLVKSKRFFKQEKIFKYLFWIILIGIIVTNLVIKFPFKS